MATQRHMEPAKVKQIGNTLNTISSVLKVVNAVLETQMAILKASALVSMFGSLAVERYIAQIQPRVKKLSETTAELAQDAIKSAEDWERAQQAG